MTRRPYRILAILVGVGCLLGVWLLGVRKEALDYSEVVGVLNSAPRSDIKVYAGDTYLGTMPLRFPKDGFPFQTAHVHDCPDWPIRDTRYGECLRFSAGGRKLLLKSVGYSEVFCTSTPKVLLYVYFREDRFPLNWAQVANILWRSLRGYDTQSNLSLDLDDVRGAMRRKAYYYWYFEVEDDVKYGNSGVVDKHPDPSSVVPNMTVERGE